MDIFRERKGWWEPVNTDDNLAPPEAATYDEYEFRYMGIENEEEASGKVKSGESAFTNLVSSSITLIYKYNTFNSFI